MAMLIAFVAMVELFNYTLSYGLRFVGVNEAKPLQFVLGWMNAPCAWLMGIPWKDCLTVGSILGERIVLNEFIGYLSLKGAREALDPRSYVVTARPVWRIGDAVISVQGKHGEPFQSPSLIHRAMGAPSPECEYCMGETKGRLVASMGQPLGF